MLHGKSIQIDKQSGGIRALYLGRDVIVLGGGWGFRIEQQVARKD